MPSRVQLKLVLGHIEPDIISERLPEIDSPPGPMSKSSEVPLCSAILSKYAHQVVPRGGAEGSLNWALKDLSDKSSANFFLICMLLTKRT